VTETKAMPVAELLIQEAATSETADGVQVLDNLLVRLTAHGVMSHGCTVTDPGHIVVKAKIRPPNGPESEVVTITSTELYDGVNCQGDFVETKQVRPLSSAAGIYILTVEVSTVFIGPQSFRDGNVKLFVDNSRTPSVDVSITQPPGDLSSRQSKSFRIDYRP
jgi:hypothetical protein